MRFTFLLFLLLNFHYVSSQINKTSIWDSLLMQHVSENGLVDYQAFKSDEAKLDEYLDYLENVSLEGESRDCRKAIYINAYNAYTVKLIIDNYPLESIKDLDNPWDKEFAVVAGKTLSLNEIEHDILRRIFNDSRIHVGVNCASISCPPLPNTAFTEKNIDDLLEQAMGEFINNGIRNKIESSRLIRLSKIFQWFEEDFTQNGSLIDYINMYSKKPIHQSAKIEYLDYNWNLNE